MNIPYRKFEDYLPVDTSKMRPKDSYKDLIKRRAFATEGLVEKYGKIPEDMIHYRPCPNCRSEKNVPELEKDYLKVVKCANCGLVFVNPVFSENFYDQMYASEIQQEIIKKLHEDSHEYRKERFGKERIKLMSRFVKGPKISYLDIGASSGYTVEAAAEVGWDAIGTELNPSAVKFAQVRGVNVIEGGLDHVDIKDKKFDVISLFDVLEHILEPMELLQAVLNNLADDGILVLYLPNYTSASVMLLGLDSHTIRPTHHLTYFTPETIISFLDSAGMNVEYMITEGLDIADYIWRKEALDNKDMSALKEIQDKLQFFVNAGGYGLNLRGIARKK